MKDNPPPQKKTQQHGRLFYIIWKIQIAIHSKIYLCFGKYKTMLFHRRKYLFFNLLFHLKEIQCLVFCVDCQTDFSQASKNASNLKIFSLSLKVFAKDQQGIATSAISGVISCYDLQQLKEKSTLINLDTIHISSEVLKAVPGFLNNFK